MRFLVDNALSPRVARLLAEAGHDAIHLRDRGKQDEPDEVVFALASQEDRVLVSADTDFGTLLALRVEVTPSVILMRRLQGRRPEEQAAVLLSVLPSVSDDLAAGALVVIDEERVRVRALPIG